MAEAGSVAPVFRDEGYVATATYDFYHAIIYNNKLYFCRQDGTIGHEPQESSDEYWFLSLDGNIADAATLNGKSESELSVGNSSALGDETAEEWQGKIDAIQTTSSATLSGAGWYRVAECDYAATGGYGDCVELRIKRVKHTNNNEQHTLLIRSIYLNQDIVSLNSKSNIHIITKVRYTYDTAKGYLEIYYNANTTNRCLFEVSHAQNADYTWQAITPTLTEETVEGVTVATTYDIPANAKPVTDLDIKSGEYPIESVGKDGYIAYPDGGQLHLKSGTNKGRVRIKLPCSWNTAMVSFRVNIAMFNYSAMYEIIGGMLDSSQSKYLYSNAFSIGTGSVAQLPVIFAHDGDTCVVTIGNDDTKWENYTNITITDVRTNFLNYEYDLWKSGWSVVLATDNSDLTVSATLENPFIGANYLSKNSPGTITTENAYALTLNRLLAGANPWLTFQTLGVENGRIGVDTDSRLVFVHTPTGYTREVLHSGNVGSYALPIGGGTLTGALNVKISSQQARVVIQPYADKAKIRGIYVNDDNVTCYGDINVSASSLTYEQQDTNGWRQYTVHHDGNSAKVLQATSAPSDTTAVWVDTANKVTKIYKDGAWTALA